jgi:hypothetical protein
VATANTKAKARRRPKLTPLAKKLKEDLPGPKWEPSHEDLEEGTQEDWGGVWEEPVKTRPIHELTSVCRACGKSDSCPTAQTAAVIGCINRAPKKNKTPKRG